METKVTEEGLKRILEIEVPVEQVEGKLEEAYRNYQREARVQGFRKGKVPLSLIKARFGKFIEGTVIEEIVSQALKDVHREKEIRPISQPLIDQIDYVPGQPLRFRAQVEVRPTIELKRYKGIGVTKRVPVVQEEDVDRYLEVLRHRYAEVRTVREGAQKGHFLVADVQRLDRTGLPLVGEKLKEFSIELGKSPLGPEFDQALIGVRVGEQKVIEVRYPKDHPDPDRAGTEERFSVLVKEITERRLPKLDDEFAREVSQWDTLEELRREIARELERQAELQAEQMVRRELINTLLHENPFEVPESLVERFLQAMMPDVRSDAGGRVDEAVVRKEFRPLAIWQIRKSLVLDEVRTRENLKDYTDEQVLDFLVQNAKIEVMQDKQERVEI